MMRGYISVLDEGETGGRKGSFRGARKVS